MLLVDTVAAVGLDPLHKRSTSIELESFGARKLHPFGGCKTTAHLHAAGDTGRQIVFKLIGPTAVGDPTASALGDLGVATTQRDGRLSFGVAKVDGSFIKLGHYLSHTGYFTLRRHADDLKRMRLQCNGRYQRRA